MATEARLAAETALEGGQACQTTRRTNSYRSEEPGSGVLCKSLSPLTVTVSSHDGSHGPRSPRLNRIMLRAALPDIPVSLGYMAIRKEYIQVLPLAFKRDLGH